MQLFFSSLRHAEKCCLISTSGGGGGGGGDALRAPPPHLWTPPQCWSSRLWELPPLGAPAFESTSLPRPSIYRQEAARTASSCPHECHARASRVLLTIKCHRRLMRRKTRDINWCTPVISAFHAVALASCLQFDAMKTRSHLRLNASRLHSVPADPRTVVSVAPRKPIVTPEPPPSSAQPACASTSHPPPPLRSAPPRPPRPPGSPSRGSGT